MSPAQARLAVRACLQAVRPEFEIERIADDTPLLAERVITSFQVLDLIVHLEHVGGRPVVREQLTPGSFRDIATIARIFLHSTRESAS